MTITYDKVNGTHRRAPPRDGTDAPPMYDLELEKHVIAACLIYPDLIMSSGVTVQDFHASAHELIWHALLELVADGSEVDTNTLRGRLHDSGRLNAVGGLDYLLALTDTIPQRQVDSPRLRKLARQRQLQHVARLIARAGPDELEPLLVQYEALRRELDAVTQARTTALSTIEFHQTSAIFQTLPRPSFVVPGLQLGAGRPMLLGGYGASSKTLSAQQLALAVASGTLAWDHFPASIGEVRHFDYEQGFRATARRYQRLALGHGIDPGRLGTRIRLATFPRLYLDSPNACDAYALACDGASLVVLDALRGATPTRDENDSSIRACLDNLARVSEVTGASFLVLHHAGKPKDGHSDRRTVLRGSSAIFEACGCVLLITNGREQGSARKVEQLKPPADAEGATLDSFLLTVEDVEIDGDPTAGVRVVHRPAGVDVVSKTALASAKYEEDAKHLLDVVRANQGASQNDIVVKSGIHRTRAIAVLHSLADNGRVQVMSGARGARVYRTGSK